MQRRPCAAVSSSGVFQGLKHPVAADDLISWTISSAHSNSRRDCLQGLWHPVVQIGKHATLKSSVSLVRFLSYLHGARRRRGVSFTSAQAPRGPQVAPCAFPCETPTLNEDVGVLIAKIARGMHANGTVGNLLYTQFTHWCGCAKEARITEQSQNLW